MKKTSLFFYLIIISSLVFADMAPIALLPGGNVVPAQNTDIQMQSEVITISLYPDYYIVDVSYTFVNKGVAQKVTMGFPSSSFSSSLATMDFKAFESENSINTYLCNGSWDYNIKSKHFFVDNCNGGIDQFVCCNVDFKEGEEKQISNTYKGIYGHCNLSNNYGVFSHQYFNYILKTGSLWKDSIESIRVIINTENFNNQFRLEKSYFQDKSCSLENFDTIFYDVDPDFDLAFLVEKTKKMESNCATSTLYPQGNYEYNVGNIDDGDKTTAWVEGKNSYGINEQLIFTSSTSVKWSILSMKIDSIGIINGYAFDDTVFSQNSRVKKIKISSGLSRGYYCEEENSDLEASIDYKNNDFEFTLKDTPEMQYLVFDTPIEANTLVITILDVYKGAIFKDTAISEILFFVDQDVDVSTHHPPE